MLGLKLPTDPRWVNLAEKSLQDILTDHAYCEQKAASSCISIVQAYPDYTEVVDAVAPVVTEEWGHFRLVLAELKKRGLVLGRQRADRYVNELIKFQRKGGSREEQLLEKLLMAALIEARSCERFRLLSLGLEEEALRSFYHTFMVSEAGHYRMFLDLAGTILPAEKVRDRWDAWLEFEAALMRRMEPDGRLMH